MRERELIDQARLGDEGAFRALYDAHVDRVYRLAYRLAGDSDLARDFTQEVFLRAYRALDQFRGDAAFSTWLHTVTVTVCLNEVRKVDRHRKRELDLEAASGVGRPARRLEPGVRERLCEAIDGLPQIYRTVFLMHDLEGFNHQEIAAAMDVAEGTSKARVSRARARLREALGEALQEYVG